MSRLRARDALGQFMTIPDYISQRPQIRSMFGALTVLRAVLDHLSYYTRVDGAKELKAVYEDQQQGITILEKIPNVYADDIGPLELPEITWGWIEKLEFVKGVQFESTIDKAMDSFLSHYFLYQQGFVKRPQARTANPSINWREVEAAQEVEEYPVDFLAGMRDAEANKPAGGAMILHPQQSAGENVPANEEAAKQAENIRKLLEEGEHIQDSWGDIVMETGAEVRIPDFVVSKIVKFIKSYDYPSMVAGTIDEALVVVENKRKDDPVQQLYASMGRWDKSYELLGIGARHQKEKGLMLLILHRRNRDEPIQVISDNQTNNAPGWHPIKSDFVHIFMRTYASKYWRADYPTREKNFNNFDVRDATGLGDRMRVEPLDI